MANTTIKTRILLRNDTLANWTNSELVLAKGEVAIATVGENLAEVRVGTGSSTWTTALKLNVDASQVSGIVDLIRGTSKQYKVVAGENDNSWKLQEASLSGGNWTDVTGSEWTVNFSEINDAISDLTADIDYLSGAIDAVSGAVDIVSAGVDVISGSVDFLSSELSTTQDSLRAVSSDYLKASDFNTISTAIGLDAASSTNKVATLSDIADLAGAMHFRGAVTPNEGETDLAALARVIDDPASGDVAIITSTSKEYVYNGTSWIELGDEVLYATKAEVSAYALKTEAAEMSAFAYDQASAYTDEEIAKLSADRFALSVDVDALVAEVSAATLTAANGYTDTAIEGLDVVANEAGNENAGFVTIVTEKDGKVAVTKKTIELSDITDVADISANIGLSNYALSTDVSTLVSSTSADIIGESTDVSSANTIYGAKTYADDKVSELSNGFLILDCGSSTIRSGEPTSPFTA